MRKYIAILLMPLLLAAASAFSQTTKTHHKAAHHKAVKHKTKHKVVAKKHPKKAVVKHKSKRKPVHHVARTHHYNAPANPIFVDTHTNSAIVEIKNGKLYVNDEAVYTLKRGKGEDQKVIINYPEPEPPAPAPQPASALEVPAEQTGGTPLLGVHTFDGWERGATVGDVLPDGPADQAGLWHGDVIKRVDDEEIDNSEQLEKNILSHKVGDKVQISYMHHGDSKSADATLGDKDKILGKDCDCGCDCDSECDHDR